MKNIRILSENFQFLVVKFSIYLNRRVFVMNIRTDLGSFNRVGLTLIVDTWLKAINNGDLVGVTLG